MAATMPAQRGSISSDFISLDFGFRGDTLLTLAAPMGITLGTQRPQNVSRFQQLLNRKLEAEKTSATPSPPAPTIPDAVDLALANFKGTNTVVERAFAGRHFVSDSEHEPQLQSIKAEPVSPRVAGTRNPLRPNPPASASATDNDLVPVPQAVGNTDQLSNQFRHMVAQRIASMFASSEANMSGADVGAPSQGNVAPSYWPQQPYADMSPYQQMVQAKFAPQPEVKVEPEQDMFRSVPWDSQPQPQPQHLLTPPAHSWQQYQSPRYPVMFGQQGGELMPDAPVPASAKSSTSSLPVPSPTTPRQSYNYAYAGPLPSSYGTMPTHNHRSSDASSIGVMDGENAPVYGPPHAVHYGSTMYGPSHGVIRLPDGAHYTTASTGDQANGAGPSGWDDTAPNGIGGGNGDIGDNAGYSGEAGGIPPPPGGGDDGNAGGAGGDGGPPDSGGGGGGGGDGGDGGDDGGDDQHPVHKKKLGKSTTDLVSVPSLIPPTALACHFCRRRKLKCDGVRPTCDNCTKRGEECTWDDFVRRRGPGKRTKELRDKARREAEAAGLTADDTEASKLEGELSLNLNGSGVGGPGPNTLAEAGEPKKKRARKNDNIPTGIGVGMGTTSSSTTVPLGTDTSVPNLSAAVPIDPSLEDVGVSIEGLEGIEGIEGMEGMEHIEGIEGLDVGQVAALAAESHEANEDLVARGLGALMEQQQAEGGITSFDHTQIDPALQGQ